MWRGDLYKTGPRLLTLCPGGAERTRRIIGELTPFPTEAGGKDTEVR